MRARAELAATLLSAGTRQVIWCSQGPDARRPTLPARAPDAGAVQTDGGENHTPAPGGRRRGRRSKAGSHWADVNPSTLCFSFSRVPTLASLEPPRREGEVVELWPGRCRSGPLGSSLGLTASRRRCKRGSPAGPPHDEARGRPAGGARSGRLRQKLAQGRTRHAVRAAAGAVASGRKRGPAGAGCVPQRPATDGPASAAAERGCCAAAWLDDEGVDGGGPRGRGVSVDRIHWSWLNDRGLVQRQSNCFRALLCHEQWMLVVPSWIRSVKYNVGVGCVCNLSLLLCRPCVSCKR